MKRNLQNFGSFSAPRPSQYYKEDREVAEINVIGSIETNPQTSCRNLDIEVGVTKSKAQRILKKHKYFPYKIKVIHNLHPGDAEKRLTFCRWYLDNIARDDNFSRKVIWSDESYITSAGIFNRHNKRHWAQQNLHVTHVREQQGRFGFSVGCFILKTKIKYVIYDGTLTANRYVEIVEQVIPDLLDDVPLAQLPRIHFQQDGAPAHNSRLVTPFLEDSFPGQWIATHGPIQWPPRSPDLSVLDFFLWAYIKDKIYAQPQRTLNDLRNATEQAFRHLAARPIIILNALNKIAQRCQFCIQHGGNQFEHFL